MHKYITVFALSALVAAQQVAACDAGYYRTWNNGWSCLPCQYGTYQPYNNYFFNSCTSVPAGYRANKDLAATARVACGGGKYSNGGGGVNSCLTCPAGTECPDQVNTSPKECDYGEYQPDAGSSQECKKCPKGSFSNIKGAASCCQCCRGYYQDDTGKTSCDKCNSNRPYSKPGATTGSYNTNNGCFSLSTPPNPGPPTSCTQTRNPAGTCPVVEVPVSTILPRAIQKRCAKGYKKCAMLHGRGGYDCVDVANDLESCGGCMDFTDSPDSGKDCTAIEGANAIQCVKGKCVVHSCKPGYQLNSAGGCDPALSSQLKRRHH